MKKVGGTLKVGDVIISDHPVTIEYLERLDDRTVDILNQILAQSEAILEQNRQVINALFPLHLEALEVDES